MATYMIYGKLHNTPKASEALMSKWIIVCSSKKQQTEEFKGVLKFLHDIDAKTYFWPKDPLDFKDGEKLNFLLLGGDGTLNYFLNNYEQNSWRRFACDVFYIPFGTGNDFARSLELDVENFEGRMDLALSALYSSGKSRNIRYAKCNERFFINTASGGSFALPVRETNEESKSFLGPIAYYQSALTRLMTPEVFDLEFNLDGERFCLKSCGFFIANGSFTGGGFLIDGENELESDQLKIIIFKEGAILGQLIDSFAHQLSDDHQWDENLVIVSRAKVIGIKSSRQIPLNLDGEVYDDFELSFLPASSSLRFKVF